MKLQKIVKRTVLHLAYKPTLDFFGSIVPNSKALEAVFEHWIIGHNPEAITFFDAKKATRLTVSINQLELVIDDSNDVEDVKELFAQIFAVYFSHSDIETVSSLNMQLRTLYGTDLKYSEYARAFYEKYYGETASLKKIFAEDISDVVQIVNGVKEGYTTNIQFGPVKPEQVTQLFPPEQFKKENIKQGSKTGLFVRTDASSSLETEIDEVLDKMDKAIDLNSTMHKQLIDFVRS